MEREATFNFVAKNGNNIERVYCKISSFRQSLNKLNMLNLFRLWRKDEISFAIVAKNGNNVEATFDSVERTKHYNRIVRHCCRLWQQVERCFDNVACCFDIVAGVDGALVCIFPVRRVGGKETSFVIFWSRSWCLSSYFTSQCRFVLGAVTIGFVVGCSARR